MAHQNVNHSHISLTDPCIQHDSQSMSQLRFLSVCVCVCVCVCVFACLYIDVCDYSVDCFALCVFTFLPPLCKSYNSGWQSEMRSRTQGFRVQILGFGGSHCLATGQGYMRVTIGRFDDVMSALWSGRIGKKPIWGFRNWCYC